MIILPLLFGNCLLFFQKHTLFGEHRINLRVWLRINEALYSGVTIKFTHTQFHTPHSICIRVTAIDILTFLNWFTQFYIWGRLAMIRTLSLYYNFTLPWHEEFLLWTFTQLWVSHPKTCLFFIKIDEHTFKTEVNTPMLRVWSRKQALHNVRTSHPR